MSDTTRPPSIEAEARRLAKDIIDSARDELAYREKMAALAADTSASLKFLQLTVESHIRDDRENFRQLRDEIGGARSSVNEVKQSGQISLKQAAIGILTAASILGGWALSVYLSIRGVKP